MYSGSSLTCKNYLSGFRVHNSDGLLNYLKADVSCPSSNLTHTFTATENNTVSEICFTTVVFCEACTNITYYDWGKTGADWLSNSVTPSSINVIGRYQRDNSMFWGMSAFNVSRGTTRDFNLNTVFYKTSGDTLSTGYSTNTGTYNVRMAHFFIATRGCNITNS
jgi:hypothetical protein